MDTERKAIADVEMPTCFLPGTGQKGNGRQGRSTMAKVGAGRLTVFASWSLALGSNITIHNSLCTYYRV
ncbi:hypothetical protein E4U38_007766 [Claviceps purpurea]|nr:hypothetical protein E4U38_007766 [Claviceps purpurea]